MLLPDNTGRKLYKRLEQPPYRSVAVSIPAARTPAPQHPSTYPGAKVGSTATPIRKSSRIILLPKVNYKE